MRFLLFLLMLPAVVAGCDTPPGPVDPIERAIVLSDFQLAPSHVDFEDLEDHQIHDGFVTIDLALSVRAEAPLGDPEAVRFLVRRPDRTGAALESGHLTAQSDGRYAAAVTVTLPAGAVGNYPVVVYAVDGRGRMSNQTTGMLRYRAAGEPPVIESAEATPNPFTPPGVLTIIATVSDPDGLENIARVVGQTPAGGSFQLFDDGSTHGDQTAGDGRFTARFDVPSASPGVQTFRLQAIDKMGLESEIVELDVTIQ